MPSRYRQKCQDCGRYLLPGDRVVRVYVVAANVAGVELATTGRELWQHDSCPNR